MGKRVVYVNPVTMSDVTWAKYVEDVKSRISSGEEVNNLLVPLSRHSTLPELQAFVKLFRPKRVVPNTLDPRLLGLDWAYIDRVFASCLYSPQSTPTSTLRLRLGISLNDTLKAEDQNDCDVALKNLVGDGAADIAERWADQGKLLKKLKYIRSHLGREENDVIDRLLGVNIQEPSISRQPVTPFSADKGKSKETTSSPLYARVSEEDSDLDSDDERGRTAHKLFAGLAGIGSDDKENTWWVSSPITQVEDGEVDISNALGELSKKGHGVPVGNGAWRVNRLTPTSSPVQTNGPIQRQAMDRHQRRSQASSNQRIACSSKASPLPFTPMASRNLSRTTMAGKGKGHRLESPICITSSSSPDIPNTSHKDGSSPTRRAPTSTDFNPLTNNPLARDKSVFLSKPRALVFHPAELPSSITTKGKNKTTATSEKPPQQPLLNPPNMTSAVELFDDSKSFNASTPMKRKRLSSDASTPPPHISSKRQHQCSGSRNSAVAGPSGDPSMDAPTPEPVLVRSPSPRENARESLSPVPYVPNEKEMHHLRRLETARQLAITYPHLVAPSYPKKRERQLAQWNRRTRERVAAAVGGPNASLPIPTASSASGSGSSPEITAPKPASPQEERETVRLKPQRTIQSFETVHDEDEPSLDWNRSKQLADRIRQDIANGRRPAIPPLISAQSQSQSMETE
ncbi:hypothetical protein NLJ89_g1591 [Agrocybe chaxingu]|uniref:DNA repair metallo-beta-lactamase domain-containing protein n=1 Tax=Agrocybe chaxingu TaxID=84603 RepID=A0A9W8MZS5_9AGAR|nr:hypothetical protein NLJ89_g1591 [Agrocybe chaxingu]